MNFWQKFRLFKWMYQNKYIDCKSFEELDIPPKLVNIQKDYVAMTRHIHSIDYIWDNMIFQHLINDIQYFASIHLISDETKEEIKKDVHCCFQTVKTFPGMFHGTRWCQQT